MKFGFRVPSLKKRISARTSLKRIVRHRVGLKMSKDTGFLTSPKKFAYNKVYNKTSFGVDKLFTTGSKGATHNTANGGSAKGCLWILLVMVLIAFWQIGVVILAIYLATLILRTKNKKNENVIEKNTDVEKNNISS